jgi:hypothetical protein
VCCSASKQCRTPALLAQCAHRCAVCWCLDLSVKGTSHMQLNGQPIFYVSFFLYFLSFSQFYAVLCRILPFSILLAHCKLEMLIPIFAKLLYADLSHTALKFGLLIRMLLQLAPYINVFLIFTTSGDYNFFFFSTLKNDKRKHC